MCGIAGILAGPSGRAADRDELFRMAAMLRDRGPDAWGTYQQGPVALVHTRLAIVGLENGAQPLTNEQSRIWISGNGEIFNHRELRRQLEARGHRFRTASDIEAIVHAYEEWGEDAWRRLNGQFAFALWDQDRQLLWLVRDPLGILPLHWAKAGRALAFASEAKALFAGGRIAPVLDPAGLAQVFTRWSTTAPDTAFTGVRSVRPGTALRVDRALQITEHVYWQPSFVPATEQPSLDEAAEALEEALDESVALRMRADVPVGCYLSGGIDSSVITALAARSQPHSLDTFSIRFADPRFDESQEQGTIARHFATSHHDFLCDSSDIAGNLADVVWRCETPLMRTAPVPLYLLSRLVRDSGRKVVLSGEGADELLAGYPIFKENAIRRFWAAAPDSTMRPLLFDRLYPDVGGADRSPAMWRHYFSHGGGDVAHPFHSHLLRWRNCGWAIRFLAPSVRAAADPDAMMHELAGTLPPGWQDWGPLERAQAIELTSFMSSYLLSCQGDRVAMAHSVEVRYPFLDPAVIRLCCSFSARLKLLGLRDKRPLRKLGRRLLPGRAALLLKRPFRAPVAYTLFGPGSPEMIPELLSEAALARQPLIEGASAGALVRKARQSRGRMASEREEMALVGLVTLQMMSEMYTTGFSGRVRDAEAGLRRGRPGISVLAEADGGMA